MGKYSDLIHQLPEERDIMEELTALTDEFVESIKITHPQKYNNFIEKIKKLGHHNHFDENTINEIKDIMNVHWSVDDTTNYAVEAYEINFDKENFNEYDFNFIMNEMYDTFNAVFQDETNKYAELSLAWLDKNKGKAYCYFEKLYK